jgi:hypothetical protein
MLNEVFVVKISEGMTRARLIVRSYRVNLQIIIDEIPRNSREIHLRNAESGAAVPRRQLSLTL